jgi:hypothetical protein
MIILDVVDLVVIAGQALGIGTEAALNQVDLPAARAALTEADCGGAVIADQAGAANAGITLMHALLRHRPFPIHGDRIAVAAGLQFLSLNGWRAELDPPATAAVIVEALACGQLSPAAAAAWLSPRLTADKRLRPRWGTVHSFQSLRPVSALQAASRKPASVIYPQTLLYIQAGCWGVVSLAGLVWFPVVMGDSISPGEEVEMLALLALVGGLAAAKAMLGQRIDRIRSRGTWLAVIITELAMTCFGLLWLFIPAFGFIMLGFIGAILSLAAVLCMTRPRARQYFFDPGMRPVNPDPRALSGPSSFSQLALTRHALAGI